MFLPESRHVPLGLLAKAFPAAAHMAPDQLRLSIDLAAQARLVKSQLDAGAYIGEARQLAAQLLDNARCRLGHCGIHCGT
jgi:hypothetical protein